jgi:hypothetical protein
VQDDAGPLLPNWGEGDPRDNDQDAEDNIESDPEAGEPVKAAKVPEERYIPRIQQGVPQGKVYSKVDF